MYLLYRCPSGSIHRAGADSSGNLHRCSCDCRRYRRRWRRCPSRGPRSSNSCHGCRPTARRRGIAGTLLLPLCSVTAPGVGGAGNNGSNLYPHITQFLGAFPAYYSIFQPIQAYSSTFQRIPAYSSQFKLNPSYSSPIRANSSLFLPFTAY